METPEFKKEEEHKKKLEEAEKKLQAAKDALEKAKHLPKRIRLRSAHELLNHLNSG